MPQLLLRPTHTSRPIVNHLRGRAAALTLSAIVALTASCTRNPPRPQTRIRVTYGSVMADVGRRFEQLGRAATADRYELAEYQLGEVGEQFEDVLPNADLPREGHPEVLPTLMHAYLTTNVPDLRQALQRRDRSAVLASFERAATACNACHLASGHGFIDIPLTAGRSVPNTDPVAR